MRIPFARQVTWYLVVAMFLIGIAPRVEGALSPSEALALSPVDRAADLAKIQKVLEAKMVGQRLKDLGFSPDEVQARLGRLSDQQLHELALKLDELKVGGDGLGILIALLVIAILVVILLQLTKHRIIVTK